MLRGLTILACVLTIVISASSAFIRHSTALSACPPGQACGPSQTVSRDPSAAAPVAPASGSDLTAAASRTSPAASAGALPPGVATARMLHRISASAVGLLVLWIVFAGWKRAGTATRLVALFALADTMFLAWLGRYTPGGLPLVTLGNLLGGIGLAGAFGWIAVALDPIASSGAAGRSGAGGRIVTAPVESAAAHAPTAPPDSPSGIASLAVLAMLVFAVAAWLGTMIQAHEAIGACGALNCAGGAHFLWGPLDPTVPPSALDPFAARGLHWLHRIAAAGFALAVLATAVRVRGLMPAAVLIALLVLQIASGARATVVAVPIVPATAHNVLACLLIVALAVVAAAATIRPDQESGQQR